MEKPGAITPGLSSGSRHQIIASTYFSLVPAHRTKVVPARLVRSGWLRLRQELECLRCAATLAFSRPRGNRSDKRTDTNRRMARRRLLDYGDVKRTSQCRRA